MSLKDSIKEITDRLFSNGIIPVADSKSYEAMPITFWENIEQQILFYERKTLIPDLFFGLCDYVIQQRLLSKDEIIKFFICPK